MTATSPYLSGRPRALVHTIYGTVTLLDGCRENEVAFEIDAIYVHVRGYKGSNIEPPEPEHCEVVNLKAYRVVHYNPSTKETVRELAPGLIDFLPKEWLESIAEGCLEDYHGRVNEAAERAAEMRRAS